MNYDGEWSRYHWSDMVSFEVSGDDAYQYGQNSRYIDLYTAYGWDYYWSGTYVDANDETTWNISSNEYRLQFCIRPMDSPSSTGTVRFTMEPFSGMNSSWVQFDPEYLEWWSEDYTTYKCQTVLPTTNAIVGEYIELTFTGITGSDGCRWGWARDYMYLIVIDPIDIPVISSSSSSSSTGGSEEESSSSSGGSSPSIDSSSSSSSSGGVASSSSTGGSPTTLSPPRLLSILFNGIGTRLIFTFDYPTTIPGTVSGATGWPRTLSSCNVVFDLSSEYRLGTSPICEWASYTEFHLILGTNSAFGLYDGISMRANVIANRDDPALTSPQSLVGKQVLAILNPVLPTITLKVPGESGSCSDLILDATQAAGLTRGYGNYTW